MIGRVRFVVCVLLVGSLVGSLADADAKRKPPPPPVAITARVVDLEVRDDARYVTVMAGSDNGITKQMRVKFREGTTTKPFADGEALLIRVDRRTTVLKTNLTTEQVRANRIVQFE